MSSCTFCTADLRYRGSDATPLMAAVLILHVVAVIAAHPAVGGSATDSQVVSHPVQVTHPGNLEADPEPLVLLQRLDAQGKPIEYCLDASSVFCAHGECNVVTVRIFWDELGFYKRYELPPGDYLEKAEGKPFSSTDHEQLHEILSDRDSLLSDVSLSEVQSHDDPGAHVDGVSAATPVLFSGATVEGAVWTCFTLWHWANGELTSIIRERTASACSLDDILTYLGSGSIKRKTFAIEQLIHRKAQDPISLQAATRDIAQQGRTLTKLALRYFELAPSEAYYDSLQQLLDTGNATQRIMVLNALLGTSHQPTPESIDGLSDQLTSSDSYQEIDLLLRLMDNHDRSSPKVASKATQLLSSENFLIARRAYWYLKNRSVTPSQEERMAEFREQHVDQL